jgi:hypothetical protein
MIKSVIVYSKDEEIIPSQVFIEVMAETFSALSDELIQLDYEYTRDGYKFKAASIIRVCDNQN